MKEFPKPVLVVSKCLGFAKCNFAGQGFNDEFVSMLKPYVKFISICPEIEINLGVPRKSLRIVLINDKENLVQQSENKNLTFKMENFSKNFIDELGQVEGFILKTRSPSCGVKDAKIYGSNDSKARVVKKGIGFFAKVVLKKFPSYQVEDEGRLENFQVRHNFFIKIFTLAKFKKIKSFNSLKKFHEENYYLFEMFDEKIQKQMSQLFENRSGDFLSEYSSFLNLLFSKNITARSPIKIVNEIYSRYSEKIFKKEKIFFEKKLEEYVSGKIPLIGILEVLEDWAIRFGDDYVLNQSFFYPYPEELLKFKNSGKDGFLVNN